MATFVKFNTFPRDLAQGIHDFSTHVFKLLLTNSAPSVANSVKADLTEIAAGSGYAAGGPALTVVLSLTGSVAKIAVADKTITAAGGAIAAFRYAAVYNDTSTGDRLVGSLDTGGSVILNDGDTYVFDFDDTNGLLQIA
jgi:hypothetical protein